MCCSHLPYIYGIMNETLNTINLSYHKNDAQSYVNMPLKSLG